MHVHASSSDVTLRYLSIYLCCNLQAFVERCNVLVSGSKDGYVRAWDLGTQHCFQTVLGQQGEVRYSINECRMRYGCGIWSCVRVNFDAS